MHTSQIKRRDAATKKGKLEPSYMYIDCIGLLLYIYYLNFINLQYNEVLKCPQSHQIFD